MKIELLQLLKQEGAVTELKEIVFSPEELDIDGEDVFLKEPVVVNGSFVNLGSDVIQFSAECSYTLDLQCARCLKKFSRTFPCSIHEIFREKEDWDGFLEDGWIDVTAMIRYSILSGMEFRYLCREDCRGLCSGCGCDLNEETCSCEKETDPQMAVLKQLLKDET